MQTQAQAEHVAYANELEAAARHMERQEAHPNGGTCATCAYFREAHPSDALDAPRRAALAFCGVCVECPEEPMVVDRSERHAWDECWTEG